MLSVLGGFDFLELFGHIFLGETSLAKQRPGRGIQRLSHRGIAFRSVRLGRRNGANHGGRMALFTADLKCRLRRSLRLRRDGSYRGAGRVGRRECSQPLETPGVNTTPIPKLVCEERPLPVGCKSSPSRSMSN
jgi:hypothetical protein